MSLTFRTWNGALLSLPLPSPLPSTTTIFDMKKKLTEIYGFRCDFLEFRSSFSGKIYEDQERIVNLHLDDLHIINLHLLPPKDIPPCFHSYNPYITKINFCTRAGDQVMSNQFPPNGYIEIIFNEDSDGNYLEINKILENQRDVNIKSMIETFGLPGAQDRGFTQWTNHIITEYIVLLDLGGDSTELEKRIDTIRYKWDGINSMYWGGDIYSWQRYTKRIPLAVEIKLSHISSQQKKMMIIPKVSLLPGGYYAVVLLHDIPVHMNVIDPSSSNLPRGVAEDKLIFFHVLNSKKKNPSKTILGQQSQYSNLENSPPPPPVAADTTKNVLPQILSSNQISFLIYSYYRTSTHNPMEISLTITPTTTVLEFKTFLAKELCLSCSQLIISLNERLLLQDFQNLLNCGLLIKNFVVIWPSFHQQYPSIPYPNYSPDTSNIISSYMPYISSISPSQYQQNVSINTSITIRFQSVSHIVRNGPYSKVLEQRSPNSGIHSDSRCVSRSLVLSCFRDITTPLPILQESSSSDAVLVQRPVTIQCGDMTKLLGKEEAVSRGHRCWLSDSETFETILTQSDPSIPPNSQQSTFSSNQRFYLIEIDSIEDFEKRSKQLRYRYNPWSRGQDRSVNSFYCDGDRYSWQRYTRYLPVMGSFVINSEQQTLIFQPALPLYSGTTYGILLANGVPSVPTSVLVPGTSPSSITMDYYQIQEDLITVFTTEGLKREVSPIDRMKWNRQDIQRQRWEREAETKRAELERQRNGDENCLIC